MEAQGKDFRGYVRLLRRRRKAFTAAALSVTTLFMFAALGVPDVYEADCTVLVGGNFIRNLIKDIAVTPSLEERVRVLSYTMKSRALLLKVAEDISAGGMSQESMEGLVRRFQKKTEITSTKEMDLFTVSYRDSNPVLARDYVNSLVRTYIETNVSEKREEAYGANRFLEEQILYFKEKLDEVEDRIVSYRAEKGIFVDTDEKKVVMDINDANNRLSELRLLREELLTKKKMIKRQFQEKDPYAVAMLGMNADSTIEGKLAVLQVKLEQLLTIYTENHPEVARTRAEMAALKARIIEEGADNGDSPLDMLLKEQMAKTDAELAATAAKARHLRELIRKNEAYLRDIPEEKKNVLELERERDMYERIYEELVSRLGQAEVSKQMEVQDKASTFKIVDPAIVPTEPVRTNRVNIMLLGIIGGLIGGFGTAVLREGMDNSVKSSSEARALGLPVLASIPHIENEEETSRKKKTERRAYVLLSVYILVVFAVIVITRLGYMP